jgi:hypothetical protein
MKFEFFAVLSAGERRLLDYQKSNRKEKKEFNENNTLS